MARLNTTDLLTHAALTLSGEPAPTVAAQVQRLEAELIICHALLHLHGVDINCFMPITTKA